MSAKPFDDAVGAIFETLEPLSPVILRTPAAGLELGAEASGRGPREEPLYTLAGAMEAFAGGHGARRGWPRPLAFVRMDLAVWIAARDASWLERAPRSRPFWR